MLYFIEWIKIVWDNMIVVIQSLNKIISYSFIWKQLFNIKLVLINFTAENIGAELKAPLKQDPLQVRGKYILFNVWVCINIQNLCGGI